MVSGFFKKANDRRVEQPAAHQAHNLEVAGSSPAPANYSKSQPLYSELVMVESCDKPSSLTGWEHKGLYTSGILASKKFV